jgi:hypothetical protein
MWRSKNDFIRQQGFTTSCQDGPYLERVLAWLGLLLIGLTAWAVERQRTESAKDVIVARLALACVTAIGCIVDRLPLPDPHRYDRTEVRRAVADWHGLARRSGSRIRARSRHAAGESWRA